MNKYNCLSKIPSLKYLRPAVQLLAAVLIYTGCSRTTGDNTNHFTPENNIAAAAFEEKADTLSGIRYMDSVYRHFETKSLSDLVKLFRFKSHIYAPYDNLRTIAYSDSIIYILKNPEQAKMYASVLAEALMVKGRSYFRMNRIPDAVTTLSDAFTLAKEKGDKCLLADVNNLLAAIAYVQEKYAVAAANYKEEYRLAQECDKPLRNKFEVIQGVLNNIGISYLKANIADSAIVYFDKGIAYINKFAPALAAGDNLPERALGVIYGNKAQYYVAVGNYKDAEAFFKKDIAINERPGYEKGDAVLVTLQLADLYMKTGRIDTAFVLLSAMKDNVGMLSSKSMLNWRRLMWGYYEQKGSNAQKYESLKSYYLAADFYDKKLHVSLGANAEADLSRLQNQKVLDEYRKDRQISNITFNALIFSLALIGCIAALIFYNWRISKRTIKKLNELNAKILEREYQLERLLDELEVKEKNKREEELQLLAKEMEDRQAFAIIEQRKKISEDLHDDISSSLAALKYFIGDLKENSKDKNARDDLAAAEEEVSVIYENTRNHLHSLSDNSYHLSYNLIRFLEGLEKRAQSSSGLQMNIVYDKQAVKKYLNAEQQSELYHIIREMLANIFKHSGASSIEICIDISSKACTCTVKDNGHGIVNQEIKAGLGLNSIANRVASLHGTLGIASAQPSGAVFTVYFPVF